MQFAGHADRGRLTMAVQHIGTVARQRPSDRHGPAGIRGLIQGQGGDKLGALGRAIGLQYADLTAGLQYRGQRLWVGHIATGQQHPQRAQLRRQQRRVDAQHAGDQDQDADLRIAQHGSQCNWLAQRGGRHHHDGGTVEQAAPDFQGGRVKGRVGGEGDPVAGAQPRRSVLHDQVEDGMLGDDHALWLSGRSGGVHDVGRTERVREWPGRCRCLIKQDLLQVHAAQAGHIQRRSQGMHQRQPRMAVVQQVGEAFAGLLQIHRHIAGAAHQHGQLCHDEVGRARH